jgi:hypothetical protein
MGQRLEAAIQHCRSYALEAERKMGEMLAATERAKGAAAGGKKESPRGHYTSPRDSGVPTLATLGVTKRESVQTQRLAPPVALGQARGAFRYPDTPEARVVPQALPGATRQRQIDGLLTLAPTPKAQGRQDAERRG